MKKKLLFSTEYKQEVSDFLFSYDGSAGWYIHDTYFDLHIHVCSSTKAFWKSEDPDAKRPLIGMIRVLSVWAKKGLKYM